VEIIIEKEGKKIVYYNEVKLWSIHSFCSWQLLMLARFYLFSTRKTIL